MRKLLPLLLVALVACAGSSPAGPSFQMLDEPMPALAGPRVGGDGTVDAADYSGRILVVNFWASWCGPCRREMPLLQSTWEREQGRGVQFIGVNSRDDEAAAKAMQKEFEVTYPSVQDPSGKIAFDFGINAGLPGTVVVDEDGTMRYRRLGEITQAQLDAMIAGAKGGQPSVGSPVPVSSASAATAANSPAR